MQERLKDFVDDETGAVTVDFVVLTAGVIGLCMLFIVPVLNESVEWGQAIADLATRNLDR
ncbi:MAG: hypothetical protein LPK12_08485 [Rhodobacterales bacterium]|nr:hypothetical protein [Rhodobacterales bacterium]MDX5500013.1 hypothetical protein [Rhodobacterales bacterium]